MIKMYRKYFALWQDFDILTSVLALASLYFSIQSYEDSFIDLH